MNIGLNPDFVTNLAGRPHPSFWLRLRHVIQAAGMLPNPEFYLLDRVPRSKPQ
jgi:hypothetical protein